MHNSTCTGIALGSRKLKNLEPRHDRCFERRRPYFGVVGGPKKEVTHSLTV